VQRKVASHPTTAGGQIEHLELARFSDDSGIFLYFEAALELPIEKSISGSDERCIQLDPDRQLDLRRPRSGVGLDVPIKTIGFNVNRVEAGARLRPKARALGVNPAAGHYTDGISIEPSTMDATPTISRGSRSSRLALGVAALAIGLFIRITQELLEKEVDAVDRTLLLKVIAARTSWLNVVMVDMTALGSATLLALFSLVALAVFAAMRAWVNALQLASASAGSLLLTVVTKSFIERVRPQGVPRLVEASGYSYPSGHSLSSAALYLTIALLIGRYLRSHRARVAVIAGSLVLIAIVSFSRVYLGVHYPSDVTSGACVGIAWALLLNAAFSSWRAPS